MDDRFNRFRNNNSIFNITEENNKFELYKILDEKASGVTYEKVRGEIEKDLDNSDITATDLQKDLIGPIIIEEYKKQVTTRKWHSESADPAKALNLSLGKQTNKQTNKKFWPHRGSNSRP